MEAENRDVVETQLTVFDLAISHGRQEYGIRFHVFNRASGTHGKALEVALGVYDIPIRPVNYPAILREVADKLEELQKEAETW
jgi:hypothetical protein